MNTGRYVLAASATFIGLFCAVYLTWTAYGP